MTGTAQCDTQDESGSQKFIQKGQSVEPRPGLEGSIGHHTPLAVVDADGNTTDAPLNQTRVRMESSDECAKNEQVVEEPTAESNSTTDQALDSQPLEQAYLVEERAVQFEDTSVAPASVVTQVAPMIQPDLDIDDEAYAESTTSSYVSSIASEISRGILENDRIYPQYGKHSYGMPVDEEEMDRMDLQHRKYQLVLEDRHFLAPISESPQRILDLATGTGIWALDVADMYPEASVLGVDIAPIQPKWVAPNCHFELDDIEDTWTYSKDSFDFIHLRDPLYMIRDWPKLVHQIYQHLKPGGWCELTCIYPVVESDDGTLPEDSMFKFMCERFIETSYHMGCPLDACLHFAAYLQNAGFTDVTERIFKMPSSPWPKDKRMKKIGALEMTNLIAGATAFGLRAFQQSYGWTREQTEVAMVGFRRDVKNRNYHQYVR